jgi:hypothetical protein
MRFGVAVRTKKFTLLKLDQDAGPAPVRQSAQIEAEVLLTNEVMKMEGSAVACVTALHTPSTQN